MFLAHWFEAHGAKSMQAKDVVAIARDIAGIPLGPNPNDFAKQVYVLGRAIGYRKDRILGGYRIRRSGATVGSVRWICERVSDDTAQPDVSANVGF